MLFLCRGHVNLLCIILILIYVLLKEVLFYVLLSTRFFRALGIKGEIIAIELPEAFEPQQLHLELGSGKIRLRPTGPHSQEGKFCVTG